MTSEGFNGNPMDEVEVMAAMTNIARGARRMYEELVAGGFSEADALALVKTWIHGVSGGKLQ